MPDALPWGTFGVNVVGSVALGVIMVLVLEVRPLSRLARPFWGVGVCGGFTTFSALQFEVYELYSLGRVGVALGYFVASVTVGVLALVLGMVVTRGVVGERP